jgi:outer membrane protein assembly factor BamB
MRVLVFLLTCIAFAGTDWPRFRGPNGSGIQPGQHLPAEIGKDRNVVWTQKTPKGHSSPIVIDGRLWITAHEGDERVLLCYDAATGALLWRRAVKKAFVEIPNPLNGPTTPTPATDGHAIFVFFPDFGLIAWEFDGKERWRVPLGPFGGVQGMAVSPVYAEGNVILQIDTPEQAYVQAFDAATGKSVWKRERPIGFLGSYATPSVYKPEDGPVQIVVAGAVELTGYQASTGERLWWVRGVTSAPATLPLIAGDSVYTTEPHVDTNSAPPFKQMLSQYDKNKNGKIEIAELDGDSIDHNIMRRLFKAVDKITGNDDGVVTEEEWTKAFDPKALPGGLVRTRLSGKGDISPNVMWRYTKGLPYVTAPLLYENVLYVVRNGGILATIDAGTGKLIKESRLKDAIADYYAQPVAADGKIYFVSKDGKVTVIRPGAEWEQLSTADLEEEVIATPAIAGDRIYIRTDGTLYCFGVSKPG